MWRVIGLVWGLSYLKEVIQKTMVRLCYPLSAPGADRQGPRLTLLKLSRPHSNSHLGQLVKLSVLTREAFAQWVAVNPDTQLLAKMQRWWKQRTSPKMHI